MYLIADPDMLKQIMVKEFSYFIDRAPVRVPLLKVIGYIIFLLGI